MKESIYSERGLYYRVNEFRADRITLVFIHGRNDTVIPYENSEVMARNIPGAKLIIMENANHIIVLNNAREVIGEIERFIV